ncbi:MAG TPA: MFS transporter [Bacillales bacterium]|nr:MFS transporter [Bacillales bacterium]
MIKLLGQTKFRNLFFGRVFSVLGDAVLFMALLKWVESHAGSSDTTTVFYIAFYLPAALFAIPIGAWVEGKALQRVMIGSDLIRGMMLVGFLLALPFVSYAWVFGYLFFDSILSLFFGPADQALLPYLVKKEERPAANGLLQGAFIVMRIAGHGMATVLIKFGMAIPPILFVSAVLVMCSLVLIARIQPVVKRKVETGKTEWRLMGEGLAYVWHHKLIRSVFSLFLVAWFIGSSIELILVTYVTKVLGRGVEDLSFFTIPQFIGMMIGAAVAPLLYRKFERKWLFVFPMFAFGCSLLSLSLFNRLIDVMPFYLLAGFSFGIFNIALTTLVQDTIEERFYTRTFSLFSMIFNFMPLPGLLIMGAALARFGIQPLIVTVAVMLALVGLAASWRLPKLGAEEGKKESADRADHSIYDTKEGAFMSLKHGILGFLSLWPDTTGYDLKKEFDKHMNVVWFSHLSQIYPELGKLEKEGLLESRTVKQEGKPDKKTYTVTKKGMEELAGWVAQPPNEPKMKDPFLMKAFFMDKIPLDEAVFQMQTYQKKHEKRLGKMRELVNEYFKELKEDNEAVTARMIMGAAVYKKGIEQEKQYVRWCEETIDFMKGFSELWKGEETERYTLKNPETSGLDEVRSLPFHKVHEKMAAYFDKSLTVE